VQGPNGSLYGTTFYGGSSFNSSNHDLGSGTVFKLTATGKVVTIYNFCSQLNGKICADGASPASGLVLAKNRNFYGTTYSGGAGNLGTFFEVTPSGKLTTLYSFCSTLSCPEGLLPNGLVQASNGNFYGTTESGGVNDYGTVFMITPGGKLTVLHSFDYVHDGGTPTARLLQASDGNFYGTAANGGGNNNCIGGCGTVFQITPAGAFNTVYSFCPVANCADGNTPESPLIQGSDGNLYGTTALGGAHSGGTVFKLTLDGQLTTLHSFCSVLGSHNSCLDGDFPGAGLVEGIDGNFYSTTVSGGDLNGGTVFQLTPGGLLTVLHTFCPQSACKDGSRPLSELIQAANGNFYGATDTGGDNKDCPYLPDGHGCGVAFAISVGLDSSGEGNYFDGIQSLR
jgi:uncharacterized repeat protein (TIGR03803 family)